MSIIKIHSITFTVISIIKIHSIRFVVISERQSERKYIEQEFLHLVYDRDLTQNLSTFPVPDEI